MWHAALVGYTVYPVTPLTSGLEPLSWLSSANLSSCIQPGNGTGAPVIQGFLVSPLLLPSATTVTLHKQQSAFCIYSRQ